MGKPRKATRPERKSECGQKLAYETQDEADQAARRPYRSLAVWGYMTSYKCRQCKKWHYGHGAGF